MPAVDPHPSPQTHLELARQRQDLPSWSRRYSTKAGRKVQSRKMTSHPTYATGQSRRANLYKMKPFRRRCLGHGALETLVLFPFLFSVVLGVPNRNLKYLSEAHFEFSIDLYRQIAAREVGNIVISAQNINLGLAMIFLGTTANTTSSTELRRALHYENMSYVDIHKAHQEILGVLADPYYVDDQDFLSKVCHSNYSCSLFPTIGLQQNSITLMIYLYPGWAFRPARCGCEADLQPRVERVLQE